MRNIACLLIASMVTLNGCVSNTQVTYFPDARGPFYCSLGDTTAFENYKTQVFEPLSLPNWRHVFALRNAATNEVIVLANKMTTKSAFANVIYNRSWGNKKITALKLLVTIEIENNHKDFEGARAEILARFPKAKISESIASDILVDIYSLWLGSEYIRAPCDGVALDNIPFEITIPEDDAKQFLQAPGESLQIAGRVLYRDAKTGWRFHRSFTIERDEFQVR